MQYYQGTMLRHQVMGYCQCLFNNNLTSYNTCIHSHGSGNNAVTSGTEYGVLVIPPFLLEKGAETCF